MSEIVFPSELGISDSGIAPHHPTQVVLTSPFTLQTQTLTRGPGTWRGSTQFVLATAATEARARAAEAFMATLMGRVNWCELPLHRPSVPDGHTAAVTAAIVLSDGGIAHRLSGALPVEPGYYLRVDNRVYCVRTVNDTLVTLDPQMPLAIGAAVERAASVRARAADQRTRLSERKPGIWGPWRFEWVEAI